MNHTISLGTALSKVSAGAIVLMSSPKWFRFAVAGRDGAMEFAEEAGLDPETFEFRAFDGVTEWRWLKVSSLSESQEPTGRFVEITDASMEKAGFRTRSKPISLLVWGTRREPGSRQGWTDLVENRIGTLQVPVVTSADQRERAVIRTVEYLAQDCYGNFRVVDQRLCALEWFGSGEGKGR